MVENGGILSRWKAASRPVQVVTVLLIVAGFAVAAGVVLSSIQRTQRVVNVPVYLDANCNSINDGGEQFSSVPMGQAVVFCLGVTNGAASALDVHTTLLAACPAGGGATVSNANTTGNDLAGSGGESCGVELSSITKSASPGLSVFWKFSVTYTGMLGDYVWTFSAVQG